MEDVEWIGYIGERTEKRINTERDRGH